MARTTVKHVFRVIASIFAVIYFLIDLVLLTLVYPLGRWIGRLRVMHRIETWVQGLNRYQTLALFLLVFAPMELIKPIGGFMMKIGYYRGGLAFIIIGTAIKLTVLERLFNMAKPKLLTFRLFAVPYGWVTAASAWIKATPVWQAMLAARQRITAKMRLWRAAARASGRRMLAALRL